MKLALVGLLAVAIGQIGIGSAQAAQTVAVTPSAPNFVNSFPFGRPDIWPKLLWVYKNVPAFDLKSGDTLSFDLNAMNDVDVQVAISMAPTTTNGGEAPAAGFTQIVPNSQVPANPRGDTLTGNYELTFTSQAAFHFPGGGLIIEVSDPGGLFATDSSADTVFNNNMGGPSDPSGFFVERIVGSAGTYPWGGTAVGAYVAPFKLFIADPPPAGQPPPAQTSPTKKKKCKKAKHRSASAEIAKKKCKKKRR